MISRREFVRAIGSPLFLPSLSFAQGTDILSSRRIVASGNIAAGSARLDLTTTNAFAWLVGVDLSYFRDGNHELRAWDSSNRLMKGVISATGPVGETLSAELFDNPAFAAVGNWILNTPPWTIAAGVAVKAATATGYIYQNSVGVAGMLAKYQVDVTIHVSGTLQVIPGSADTSRFKTIATAAGNNQVAYINGVLTGLAYGFFSPAAGDSYTIDNASLKRVTDPPSTAAQIVNGFNSPVRAWASQQSDFDATEAIRYEIWKRIRRRVKAGTE